MHLASIDIQSFLMGGFVWLVIAYAARTIPAVKNPWAKWIIGIFQFAVANVEQAKLQVTAQPPEQPR